MDITSYGSINPPTPRKHAGFCEEHGIEHAWQQGPTYTMSPPIATRHCVNCGHSQRMVLADPEWED